jgi:putative copper export protein
MDFWLFLHLVAMAFFLGGQLMLAAVVVPVVRGGADTGAMKAVARRFGIGSAVAIAVMILSGLIMASHYNLWSLPEFHIKMTLFLAVLVALALHIRFSGSHVLMAVTFVLTLGVVWTGIMLPV